MNDDPDLFLKQAKEAVSFDSGLVPQELYIVWFSKVLGSWKALVSSDNSEFHGVYYEVTCDIEEDVVYVDRYVKERNSVQGPDFITTRVISN